MVAFQFICLLLPTTAFTFHLGLFRQNPSIKTTTEIRISQDSSSNNAAIEGAVSNLVYTIEKSLATSRSSTYESTRQETEVDEGLYEITRTTQYLEQVVSSIKDNEKDEDKIGAIQPAFKNFENSLKDLAGIDDLRRLTDRESEDRLALFQTVRLLLNESMDALVGKAVVLPKDFKEKLSERLGDILEYGTKIAAVVRYGVAYAEQMQLTDELLAVNKILRRASNILKSAEGKDSNLEDLTKW